MRLMIYAKSDSEQSFFLNDYSSQNLLGILDDETHIHIRNFYAEEDDKVYTASDIASINTVGSLKEFLLSRGEFFIPNKLMFDIEDEFTVRFNDDSDCQVISSVGLRENIIANKILMGLGYDMKIFESLENNIGSYVLMESNGSIHRKFKDFDEYIESDYS